MAEVSFHLGGKRITPLVGPPHFETPKLLEMEDNDTIDVYQEQVSVIDEKENEWNESLSDRLVVHIKSSNV